MKVIIIGAGAAGIMAANVLAKKGIEVLILERNNRIGGRIHTFVPHGFLNTVEAGAEFIHGDLPLTSRLLKKAKLNVIEASMNMHRFKDGKMVHSFGNSKAWGHFYEKLAQLEDDITVNEFLQQHFPGEQYELLHKEVREMAEGLDLANPDEVSMLSLKEEWLSEETQFRPVTGYQPFLEFLYDEAAQRDCEALLNQVVENVQWEAGKVIVKTQTDSYNADKVIITASLGCLQKNDIHFIPEIPQMAKLFHDIGFGHVIKIALEFEHPFWEKELPDLGFLFVDHGLTFWTQLEQRIPVLTGWIGNDYAAEYDQLSDEIIIDKCIDILSEAFSDAKGTLRKGIVFRYTDNSISRGGYSWPKPQSKKAVKEINKGIEATIYFAGEAFDPTFETATVEAALESGRYVAGRVLGV